ncbi:TonB-dependent receptor [Pseudoalteromonas piscicida]|uniref:TonB-dependent receptor n=1 Tax=Pseudoalteromonas piscicida TaxID=43662 RepID=A0AAQ2ERT5_PSEO7|nr:MULTISPECIES: TonB-dependent receptor [Pseudoalteromonas]KJY87737.1 TonB-dependent receptor [Pseudoalteromonas piscicida]TMN35295.1 TonB-dependent receptor [Pseudoalteromonas piscicida]TMN39146.1 TonB-dependent receptor [Pseudoalteromonas piscicida]TMN54315.1 TonB-dependent receptor [Pseudoalteromonas piscicida]TMN55300.1 TonB-dependent receptor [Pseudoalteromonas piscicida]
MQYSRSSVLSASCVAVKLALLGTSTTAFASEDIEKISVYGKHNKIILQSGTATKSNMDLMQTPAAVVVVDKELLDSQSAATLQEALRNVSGLSQAGNNYGIGDSLMVRGLGVNYTYDGMYGGADLGNSFNPTRSLTNIESIEVLKGPATGLYGIGAAGGVVNLVEKKPQFEQALAINGKVGAWNTYGLGVDFTDAITDKLAYRVVANHERSDGYRDLESNRDEIYASLRFEQSSEHALLFSTAYIDDSQQVDSIGDPVRIINWDSIAGQPGLVTAERLPNDPQYDVEKGKWLGVQLNDEQRAKLAESIRIGDGLKPFNLGDGNLISPLSRPNEGEELRIKLRHDWYLNRSSKLTQQILWRSYDSDFVRQTGAYNYVYWERNGVINANPRAPLVIDDVLYPYAARRQEYRRQVASEKTWQYFADLQLTWDMGSLSGEHLVSVNYENRDMRLKSWSAYDADGKGSIPYILDIREPNWPTGEFEDYNPSLRSNYDKTLTAYGISAQEVVYITDALTARAGLAYTSVEQKYQHLGTERSPEESEELDTDDAGMTYNIGLNYQVTSQLSAFVNMAKGRTAYSVLGSLENEADANRKNRPDSESETLDIGVRFTAFDEDLLGSLVWFETKRTNLMYNNPEYNEQPGEDYNVSVPRYFFDDEDESKGVELDLNLALNDQVSVNMNATYQDAVEIRSNERSGQMKGVPKKFASTWVKYTQPVDWFEGALEYSLGINYESERTINSVSFGLPTATIDGYTRWDAAIKFDAEQFDIQLNLENLTDERYYSKALFLGGTPGNERNAKLSFNYRF